MKIVNINASKSYNIKIEQGLIKNVGKHVLEVKKPCKVLIVSDDVVHSIYGEDVFRSLKDSGFNVFEFTFIHGEKSKNIKTYSEILNFLAKCRFNRGDLIIALGGGVCGDMAGFAASTYMRGVDYVQIPTTLLSMIDSSVGGKTAIDLESGKNLVGTFYQPILVLIDTKVLESLPCSEYKNGMGEGIKYAVLDGGELLDIVDRGVRCSNQNEIDRFVELCVISKKNIVEKDEKESNIRRLLNLGHTFAHAIEQLSGYTIAHGVCVANGLRIILDFAKKQKKIDLDDYKKINEILDKYEMPVISEYSLNDMVEDIKLDKKAQDTKISLVIPYKIGDCKIETIDIEKIKDILC